MRGRVKPNDYFVALVILLCLLTAFMVGSGLWLRSNL